MSEFVQVMTTLGSREEADRLARGLVEDRLAACVQVIGPISSTYRWQGEVETTEEWLALAKTTAELYGALETAIRHRHSYEVPEILAVPVAEGNPGYLDWVRESVTLRRKT
jgi:periplasmic divalent cation tolerance protein